MLHHVLAEADAGLGIGRVVRDGGASGPLVHREHVGDLRVVPHLAVGVGVGKIDELRDRLHGGVDRRGHGSLAGRTALRGHEDDAVGASHTEHGRGRCILQDRDALDLVGIQLGERTFDAVDQDQRLGAVERADAADADDRFIGTRHTGGLDGRNAREVALEGVRHVRDRGLQEAFAADRGNGTGDGDFLLLAVRNDDSLVKSLRVDRHRDGDVLPGHLDLLGGVADTGNLQCGASGDGRKDEVAVKVSHGTVVGPLNEHAGSDQPIPVLIKDFALHT